MNKNKKKLLNDFLIKILTDKKYYKEIKKNILQFDKNNNYISKYSSLKEIQDKTKIHYPNISDCLHGRRKTAGGFIWKYEFQKILEDINGE